MKNIMCNDCVYFDKVVDPTSIPKFERCTYYPLPMWTITGINLISSALNAEYCECFKMRKK